MVKEKVLRIYDKDGFRRRAACICVRSVDESEVSESNPSGESGGGSMPADWLGLSV